jgi:hypothetical protein
MINESLRPQNQEVYPREVTGAFCGQHTYDPGLRAKNPKVLRSLQVIARIDKRYCGSRTLVPTLHVVGFGLIQDGDVGSESFQRVSRLGLLQENNVGIIVASQNSETLSIRRQAE